MNWTCDVAIDESLRGKWWTPEELGIIDYSQSLLMPETNGSKPIVSSGLFLEDVDLYESSNGTNSTAVTAGVTSPSNTRVEGSNGIVGFKSYHMSRHVMSWSDSKFILMNWKIWMLWIKL